MKRVILILISLIAIILLFGQEPKTKKKETAKEQLTPTQQKMKEQTQSLDSLIEKKKRQQADTTRISTPRNNT